MATVSSLTKIYKTYLNTAKQWMRQRSYDLDVNVDIRVQLCGEDLAEVSTTKPLHFKNWPYRFGSRERIDVLAEVHETVQLSNGHCVKATIRVNYFRIEGGRAIATEALHYDIKSPPDQQHPICHVQTSNSMINGSDSFTRLRKDVDSAAIKQRCQTMRIPSAFVNLPGLLSILAADHMSPDNWREFMAVLLKTCVDFPKAHHVLVDNAANGQLCAWSWYEH